MINDDNHYQRVKSAMVKVRWDGVIPFEAFIDRERTMYGETEANEKDVDSEIEYGKRQVKAWMNAYSLNRWSNQPIYLEVWVEKKAIQGVFERPCLYNGVGLAPCKGYPSLTFLNEARERFEKAIDEGKTPLILYYGDYDPSGKDIPRSLQENLYRMGVEVEVRPMALNPDQIKNLGLVGVPPKRTDTRTRSWTGGDVVELDAIEPRTLADMCKKHIKEQFDEDLYDELKEKESEEKSIYKEALKDFVNSLGDDEE